MTTKQEAIYRAKGFRYTVSVYQRTAKKYELLVVSNRSGDTLLKVDFFILDKAKAYADKLAKQ